MIEKENKTTEQAIIEAAEDLFLKKGYAKTSTVEIAKVAGCNQALVHYYYRSKENLFRLIFEKKAKMFVSSIIQTGGEDLPFEEKLKIRIAGHFEMVRANKRFPVLLFNEMTTNAEMLEHFLQGINLLPFTVIVQIQAELDAEAEKKKICKTDARTLLFNIFSLNVMAFMASPMLRFIMNTTEEQFDQLLEEKKAENIRFILNSLRP